MTSPQDVGQSELVPIACSLDAAGLVERRGEFAGLFGGLLVAQERLPRELRLTFAVGQDGESAVRELFRREQECCPFFSFQFSWDGEMLVVTMAVPDGAEGALDGFAEMAASACTTARRATI